MTVEHRQRYRLPMTDRQWCSECGGWGEWVGFKADIGMPGMVCCPKCKGEGLVTMTERTIKRGDRVLVWATGDSVPAAPCDMWWVNIDDDIGVVAVSESAMIISPGESAQREPK